MLGDPLDEHGNVGCDVQRTSVARTSIAPLRSDPSCSHANGCRPSCATAAYPLALHPLVVEQALHSRRTGGNRTGRVTFSNEAPETKEPESVRLMKLLSF